MQNKVMIRTYSPGQNDDLLSHIDLESKHLDFFSFGLP